MESEEEEEEGAVVEEAVLLEPVVPVAGTVEAVAPAVVPAVHKFSVL